MSASILEVGIFRIFEKITKNPSNDNKNVFVSKICIATLRPALHFRVGSEVSTESKDTLEVVSTFLGSLLESVGTIRGDDFNF